MKEPTTKDASMVVMLHQKNRRRDKDVRVSMMSLNSPFLVTLVFLTVAASITTTAISLTWFHSEARGGVAHLHKFLERNASLYMEGGVMEYCAAKSEPGQKWTLHGLKCSVKLLNAHSVYMILSLCLFYPLSCMSQICLARCMRVSDRSHDIIFTLSVLSFIAGVIPYYRISENGLPKYPTDKRMHLVLSLPQLIFMTIKSTLLGLRFTFWFTKGTNWTKYCNTAAIVCFYPAKFFYKFVDWLSLQVGDEILGHFLGRIIPLASLLALGSGMMSYHQMIIFAMEKVRSAVRSSIDSTEHGTWLPQKDTWYFMTIIVSILVLTIVFMAVGFLEHHLYFHGQDLIYYEKFHRDFVKIGEAIRKEEAAKRMEEGSKQNGEKYNLQN